MTLRPNGDNLKIAVQRQGRLANSSLELLHSIGLDFDYFEGRLFAPCRNFPLDLLFLRDDDIPEYVQDGVADLGMVGINVVEEKGARVTRFDCLGFGSCTLAIAVARDSPIRSAFELQGKRIATSYPRTLGRFLEERGIAARIIEISGSVEITPSLDIADAICDLVSSGSTLKLNGLEAIETVLKSEAVLIVHPESLRNEKKNERITRLRLRLQSNLRARRTKYVMMNAPSSALSAIQEILPGLQSPTVLPLAEEGMIAVHTAVPEETFWDVIENLKKTGARDILVIPVEKMVV